MKHSPQHVNALMHSPLGPFTETHHWQEVSRRAFLAVSPLGALSCLTGIVVQLPSINPIDLALLSLLAATLLVCAALLWLHRMSANQALGAAYIVSATYFVTMLANEYVIHVGQEQQLSEATYWFPVLFCTAFLAWEIRRAAWIVGITYALMIAVTVASVPIFISQGNWNMRLFAIMLQFLLAQGVSITLMASLAFLKQRLTQVRTIAYMDALTGLPNRRLIEEHWQHLGRQERAVVLFDVDHFKQVNDRHGHDTGDAVLREMAILSRRFTHGQQLLGRWGGEEFLLILPHYSEERAAQLVELIRRTIESHPFHTVGHVTASFGVTEGYPQEPLRAAVERADYAMYHAKQAGRNQVKRLGQLAATPAAAPAAALA